ncbi:hypothetical protein DRJ00_04945 [Candidatus Aerophobetes bacterium]|uniref:Transposase IS204/IS1001/IS1096/IS1165 DDE domain-containing protein n=1 Tax=Aerophobetes bacterium TaxID=2030807 RepID=A0A497E402_UNCAE|nr:MAG: hypothetical protein DRJ00_04945 [Candidatus Aerophobetes bacterium]
MYQVRKAGIPEFLKLAKTTNKWEREILNYFRTFLSNGPIEGVINKVKLIKRITYDLPNFEHLRARILIECGCHHSSPKIVKEPLVLNRIIK